MKYIFVTGGVMSGLGKGITAASIGRILKNRGYNVTAVKIDPYLNIDAGTMNPAQHGEVFVLYDGGEVDLDLGNYERFLGIELSSMHNITTGKVYRTVIEKERKGEYLGETVQIIPHITDQIIDFIHGAATEKIFSGAPADVCLVEVGGTVGDIESMPFLEAVRQMRGSIPASDRLLVHVTLMPSDSMGELKTKPTQHSIKALRELGLFPDVIIGRSDHMISAHTKKKLSALCDISEDCVFSAKTVPDIYQVPLMLENEGFADVLVRHLELEHPVVDQTWNEAVSREYVHEVTVGIVTKYGVEDVYLSIKEALRHAGRSLETEVQIQWLDAECFTDAELSTCDGILVPGGFGIRGIEGKIDAIQYARENNKPFLGLCLGFQLAVSEYARNVLGYHMAGSSEFDAPITVITLLPEQEDLDHLGGTMRLGDYPVFIQKGTIAYSLYGTETILERHRHRYEVEPAFIVELEKSGLKFSGKNKNRMEILEMPTHPFFFASQFHPEFRSNPMRPSPPFIGFVTACLAERGTNKNASSGKKE
ncbi:MAG: CTP synthase [Methanomicrobiales archaeon]|nr:CTP synthase [Methanomicrobiales archaeon]